MNKFNKFLGYCGCLVGALSFFLFVVLPGVLFAFAPETGKQLEEYMNAFMDSPSFEKAMTVIGPIFFGFMFIGIPLIAFSPLWLGFFRDRKKKARLKMVGVKGMAKIIDIQDTGITVNNSPLAKFTVEIAGTQVQINAYISRVSMPRIGESIEVVYDPSDPTIVLPAYKMQ